MPIGGVRAAILGSLFVFHFTTNAANVNLRTTANSLGYAGGNALIFNDVGVLLYSATNGVAGVVPGAWPAGVSVLFVNNGAVQGWGALGGAGGFGDSGSGGWFPGANGLTGGTALDATAVSGFVFKVDNTSGAIRGGGGGGGGGGGYSVTVGKTTTQYVGQTGGTGAGAVAATGPSGGTGPTPSTGGTGGGYATGGSNGSTGVTTGVAGFGGAGGNAVTGNANIVWIATGTRTGAVT